MAKIRVKVKKGFTTEGLLWAYRRTLHQHLRYAGVVDIEESETSTPFLEFSIEVPDNFADQVVKRIMSFGDFAEIIP